MSVFFAIENDIEEREIQHREVVRLAGADVLKEMTGDGIPQSSGQADPRNAVYPSKSHVMGTQ